jgi:hypothetical protein
MPFVVSQANAITLAFAGALLSGLTLIAVAGYRHAWPVQIGFFLSYGVLGICFAIPFNPYRRYSEDWRGKRTSLTRNLSTPERRVLAAFYDPRNRRRAVLSVFIAAMSMEILWWCSLRVLDRPIAGRSEMPGSQVTAVIVLMGLGLAGWTGCFGLTVGMRRNWSALSRTGLAWPVDVEYSGPLKEAIRSLLTGVLPSFLADAEGGVGERTE